MEDYSFINIGIKKVFLRERKNQGHQRWFNKDRYQKERL